MAVLKELVYGVLSSFLTLIRFCYACFLRPLSHGQGQKGRLDSFYGQQANIYDASRKHLLQGRETMLQMTAAMLNERCLRNPGQPLVWVDIGGGTGYNIEAMDKYFGIGNFHAVYLLDLCEPLLEVAKQRIAARGWKNVYCLAQDATNFKVPNSPPISLVTLSYSLSMIPNFYATMDRVHSVISPDGIVAVVDFYVSSNTESPFEQAIGAARRRNSWFSRLFWLHWFEFDHVDLHPSRRQYLEWRFETIKSYNGRNKMFLVKIPYYIWLGCKSSNDVRKAVAAFSTDSPVIQPYRGTVSHGSRRSSNGDIDDFSLEPKSNEAAPEKYTAFHYVKGRATRLPYRESAIHKEFRTFIYSFVWEDPVVDIEHFGLTEEDTMMVITSAGDNALHYAIAARPKTIHCVDMNPCQGHLLELKLAAATALNYEEFWQLFGEGKHRGFREMLSLQLSPFLSSHAYQFWAANNAHFDDCFYFQGYSGWPLRLIKWAGMVTGKTKDMEAFAQAPNLETQRKIWEQKLRGLILHPLMKIIVSNSAFLWNALGVPINQASVLLRETTMAQYAVDTVDPVAEASHIRDENYHYYLCLARKYSPKCCPLYLTKKGFEALRADNGRALDTFRLHTDTIINVLNTLQPESLTVWVGMDFMDWSKPSEETAVKGETFDRRYLRSTLTALHRTLKPGGRAFWRSAGMNPWYADLFEEIGFVVERISVRHIGTKTPIDNVNMYASFWKATKLGKQDI